MKKTLTLISIISLLFCQTIFSQSFNYTKLVDASNPTGVLLNSSNEVWYIIQGSGLFEFDGTTSIDHSTGFVTTNIVTCETDGTTIWAGGYGGITNYDGTTVTNYSSSVGDLQGYAVYDVNVNGNNIWLAMESEGASHFDGTTWTHYTSANGLEGDWFTAIEEDNSGNIWLTSVDYGTPDQCVVNMFNGTSWTSFAATEGITLTTVNTVFADINGDIWIGGDGVMKYDGTTWSTVPVSLLDNDVRAILEDNAGNMWFAENSESSIIMYDGTTSYDTNLPEDFSGRTDGIGMNSNGEMYFCLDDGIYTVEVTYPPVTDFIASSTSVCLGDEVIFTDQSSNEPTQWTWDFGDGNTSTIQNPTHIYTSPGTYTVILTATNAGGTTSESKIDYIVVSTIDNSATQLDNVLTATATGVTYQWVDCNASYDPIAGETNQTFTATTNGSYAVIVSDGICTAMSNCFNVTTIAIDRENTHAEANIYPNPATNYIYVEMGDKTEAKLKIYDILGSEVMAQKITSNNVIDISNIPEGMYIFRLFTETKIIDKKIMINK